MLCQFTDRGGGPRTLVDFVNVANVYPAGLLDFDSEGLLLTDDGALAHRLTDPGRATGPVSCRPQLRRIMRNCANCNKVYF